MMSFIEKYYDKKRAALVENEAFLATPWAKMMSPFTKGLKAFREPNKSVSVEDYDGPDEYFTFVGFKLFKKPRFLINKDWKCYPMRYYFRLSELNIFTYPKAICVKYGKTYTLTTSIPETNTTSLRNYWLSLIEYQEGMGAHRGSINKTVVKLGKESMGVQFDDYNPHKVTLYDDDYMEKPAFGNSMYFVVDKSYVRPEMYQWYDMGADEYNRNESPLMI